MANVHSSTSFLPVKVTVTFQQPSKEANNQSENNYNNAINLANCLNFLSLQKVFYRLLICNRDILLLHVAPKNAESGLVKKIDIALKQFRRLQKSLIIFSGMARLPHGMPINLYCGSKLQYNI